STIRTARSRTSAEYLLRAAIAPSSQRMEPPAIPGRFIPDDRVFVRDRAAVGHEALGRHRRVARVADGHPLDGHGRRRSSEESGPSRNEERSAHGGFHFWAIRGVPRAAAYSRCLAAPSPVQGTLSVTPRGV